ncbi:FecR domain-containing protein [Mucilaginibacter mali]|uniref:FecR domain-containing protein n=1 Tax=Mucilaginibacter mali TaxID=2740462 RepID=A0A7D4UM23_9SPHI|nr:FecR domain-containing protein [Mucilaginibacter mali]QKJ30661.1 FecR domain-containing protein [Mucilaginibacter mali]
MDKFPEAYIAELWQKFQDNSLSAKEKEVFFSWYSNLQISEREAIEADASAKIRIKTAVDAAINDQHPPAKLSWLNNMKLISVAASVLIVTAIALFFLHDLHAPDSRVRPLSGAEVTPGSLKAYLTLPNGTRVELGKGKKGNISSSTGNLISQSVPGRLVYDQKNNSHNLLALNTLTTPKGGECDVILPDGTHVWLNAASSLTYPEEFSDTIRKVKLEGEAYFEVAHERSRRFIVQSGSRQIEVLGTHFNIRAYDDEPEMKTTLVQGRVKVTSGNRSVILKPGQQAAAINNDNSLEVRDANVNLEIAWRNGMIMFQDAKLTDIMKQVARWYNIKVQFTGKDIDRLFNGGFSRGANLEKMLEILEANHIPFVLKRSGEDKVLEIGQS